MTEGMLLAGIAVLFVIMGIYYARSRHRYRKMFFGALTGVAALYPASLAMTAAGIPVAMNLFNVTVSAILGIPGVMLLLVSRFL